MPGPDYESRVWSRTTWIQIGYCVWASHVLVSLGMIFGFSGVALPKMVTYGMKDIDKYYSWIASSIALASTVGSILSALLMDRVGRRAMMVLCVIPIAIGWFTIAFSRNVNEVLYGRLMTGLGVGMASIVPRLYCTEITLPKMRRIVGIMSAVDLSLGIILQAVLGALIQWKTLSYICGFHSIILMLINFFLPESPYFLLMNGSLTAAKTALSRVRCRNHNIEAEMADMVIFKQQNTIRRLNIKEAITLLFWSKTYLIIIIHIIIGQLSGVSIVLFYTVDMLTDAKINIDPFKGNVMVQLSKLISVIIVVSLVSKIRRKPLAYISAIAVSGICLSFGCFLLISPSPSIVPLVAFIFYMTFAHLGYQLVPLLMLVEMWPLRIRGMLGSITVSIWHLTIFVSISVYPYIRKSMSFHYIFIGFGLLSLLGFIHILRFLSETKELAFIEVEEYYSKRQTRNRKESGNRRSSSQTAHKSSIEIAKIADANKHESILITPGSSRGNPDQPQYVKSKTSVTFSLGDEIVSATK